MEIFNAILDYEIQDTVLKQKGKMCAEIGQYVRLSDYQKLKKENEGLANAQDLFNEIVNKLKKENEQLKGKIEYYHNMTELTIANSESAMNYELKEQG